MDQLMDERAFGFRTAPAFLVRRASSVLARGVIERRTAPLSGGSPILIGFKTAGGVAGEVLIALLVVTWFARLFQGNACGVAVGGNDRRPAVFRFAWRVAFRVFADGFGRNGGD